MEDGEPPLARFGRCGRRRDLAEVVADEVWQVWPWATYIRADYERAIR
jgi:hypothetical protein